MKSVLGLVCAGVLAGIVGATVFRVARPVLAQGPQAAQAGGRPGQPPRIPPLASPPLYPDQKPTVIVWTSADMKKVYDARVAAARGVTSATAAPRFESLQTRTHGVSLFFRTKFDSPRPANRSGIVSLVDDADQHEGVTDFYVIAGGTGQMVTDGEIEHRQYGHNPRGSAESGAKTTVVFPGEFNGQPIRDGRTYDVAPGDWLAIPPGVPHWPGYNPGNGLMYVGVKINIGLYGPNTMY
ncbi:MAG: hypothetical protein DMF89_11345 [Acidobacteria bacterium]|nr:MAG: hypothetical protein DMF90_11520 [Acidobacteriota bacterium]PYR49778.1 MAG: hypothetical protein DMF89_11345 [Acidobacteriota bacterium]